MILYHGSNVTVEKPRLLVPSRNLDFGAGFYTTTNKQQAINFSRKVVDRAHRLGLGAIGVPSVSIYEFDESKAEKILDILKFERPNAEWLKFVGANRRSNCVGKKYDLIIGAVANDDIYPTLIAFESGILSESQTLDALKIKRLFDQYAFTTEKALGCLNFVSTLSLED